MHSKTTDEAFAKRFDGRFSDGTTAGSQRVDVRLSKQGLLIYNNGDKDPTLWPYEKLAVAEPLRKNSIDALVTCSGYAGSTLFVPGGVFARMLGEYAPQLTTGAERWRNARPWLLTALAASVIVGFIYVADISPARHVAMLIPDKMRDSLGKHSLQSMVGKRGVCVAKEGREALDRLVSRLSLASGTDTNFKVTVADWGLLNAFATPGEYIVVTRKLITTADSPDELAGVLAHEMGHGISLHPETGLVRVVGLSATFELLVGGGGGTLANLGILLAQLSYTRGAEIEADEHALRILKAAKISPTGLAKFFKRVSGAGSGSDKGKSGKENDKKKKEAQGSWTQGLDILRTHPAPSDRLERVMRQAVYPATPALNAEDWAALKKICSKTEDGAGLSNSGEKSMNQTQKRRYEPNGSDEKWTDHTK